MSDRLGVPSATGRSSPASGRVLPITLPLITNRTLIERTEKATVWAGATVAVACIAFALVNGVRTSWEALAPGFVIAVSLVWRGARGLGRLGQARPGEGWLRIEDDQLVLRHWALENDVTIPADAIHSVVAREIKHSPLFLPVSLSTLRDRMPGGKGPFVRLLGGPTVQRGNLLLVLSPPVRFPRQRKVIPLADSENENNLVRGLLLRVTTLPETRSALADVIPGRLVDVLNTDVPQYLYAANMYVRNKK